MPLHSSSYFAGVATVIATITLGFAGGILMTDTFVGNSDNAPKLAERRTSPLSESTAPAASNSEVAPALIPPTAAIAVATTPAAPAPALAVAQTQPGPPEEAMAKAREEDVKKALAVERRKAERRKWAERRKQEMRKIAELNAVAEKVRDAERERGPNIRSFFAQSPEILVGDD